MAPVLPTDDDPTARDEGNAAHWMAQQIFNGVPLDELIDRKAFNGFTMTAEMSEHVMSYLNALDCGEMEIETSFEGVAGRADHISYREPTQILTIDDFKYGWRIVEPVENWTLIAHAVGYCENTETIPREVVFRIHQPRPHHPDGPLREWRISWDQLQEYAAQIKHTLSNPNDQLRSGLGWCHGCRAYPECPAARKARFNAIDAASSAFSDQLDDIVLGHELDLLRTAAAHIKMGVDAIEELVIHRLKTGSVFQDYGLEEQYAHTRWKTGIDGPTLTIFSGVNCTKPGTITPAEARRRGMSEVTLKSLTERPMIGVKLVRASADQRAKRIFKKGK